MPFADGSGGSGADGIALTPDGRYAYMTNFAGSVSGFSVGANGSLTALLGSPYPAGLPRRLE